MLDDSPIDRDLIEPPLPEGEALPLQPPNHLSLEPPLVNPWRHIKIASRRPYRAELFDHAAPLSPLRDRDLEIMAGWFDRVDMTEVEQDIDHYLSMLYPEPPWEDALDLNFLKDHL